MKVSRVALGLALGGLALELVGLRRRTRLRGATAVVCGASRGLGRAIVLELARRGAKKIAICARHEEDLEGLAADLVLRGIPVVAKRCDLTNRTEVDDFFEDVQAQLGPVDIVVTNAATMAVGPFAAWTKNDFDEAHASIFESTLNAVLAAVPGMRQRRKGTIAMITSIGAKVGVPHLAPYCAAKFAVMGLAESIRPELAVDGVNVLAVVPGLMRTGSHVHAQFKGDHALEYAWFATSATAPLLSIDADRAARRIVGAIGRGSAEVAFTPEARLAPLLRVLAPNLWTEALTLVARLLPRPPVGSTSAQRRKEGVTIEAESSSPLVTAAKKLGRRYAERHEQHPLRPMIEPPVSSSAPTSPHPASLHH
jgi:NAD(P)-dependent dehydrogenase (short-subunit alcohol dehydrogenase family)